MKIRIAKNTMRFRLSEDEIICLENGSKVQEKISFPNDKSLIIELNIDKNITEEFNIIYNENKILLNLSNFILEEIKEDPKGVKLENSMLVCYVEVDLHKHS